MTTRHRTRRPGEQAPAPEPRAVTEPDKRYCGTCWIRVADNHELAEHYRQRHL